MTRQEITAAKLALLGRAVEDRSLTHLDVRVICYLYSSFDGSTGATRRKQAVIAAAVGAKRRGVQQCIDRIRGGGYIAVETSRGLTHSNTYSLPKQTAEAGAKYAPESAFTEPKMRTVGQQNAHAEALKCAPPCAHDYSLSLSLAESPARERRARATPIPNDWKLSDDDRDFALSEDVQDVDGMAGAFRDYYRSTGKPRADWSAAWRGWVRKERQFTTGQRGAVIAASDRLRGKVRGVSLSDDAWEPIIARFVKTGIWTRHVDQCGNAPPAPDCRAPRHLLVRFGLVKEAAA
jgi:hypothetical protein